MAGLCPLLEVLVVISLNYINPIFVQLPLAVSSL